MQPPEEPIYEEVFDIRYRETKQIEDVVIMSVPPEDVFVDPNLTGLNLDKAQFVAHRMLKTYTELLQMGYDREKLVEAAETETFDVEGRWNEERQARLFDTLDFAELVDSRNQERATRRMEVYECYLWIDHDRTGEAQFRRIVMIGDRIFDNEEVAYQPLVAMSAAPFPHKHQGLSLGQMAEPQQRLNTSLHRQLLNNVSKINNNQLLIGEDAFVDGRQTHDALENRQSTVVPMRGMPGDWVMPVPVTGMVGDLLPVIQHVAKGTALRTGVVPDYNVEPQQVQNTPASSMMGAMDLAGDRAELTARILAETGIKMIFRKIHYLCRAYPDMVTTIKLTKRWIKVDASQWPERTDVKVNIGLGFNNKQQKGVVATQLIQVVQEAMQKGLSGPMGAFNALMEWVEAHGIGTNAEKFFIDPSKYTQSNPPPPEWVMPPPPPEPAMIVAQTDQMKSQAEIEQQQQEMALEAEQERQRMALEMMKARSDENIQQIEAQVKLQEAEVAAAEARVAEQEAAVAAAKVQAEIEEKRANVRLKDAQAMKAIAEAGEIEMKEGKTLAEIERTDAETDKIMFEIEKPDAGNEGGGGDSSQK